ncbi:MAG: iron chelate uptake ABC transporter family permease subunit [Chlamydiota bacterium]
MKYSLLDFFCHPVLRASALGSMLMGLSAALIGGMVLVQRRSLIGEALSHAAYPGVLIAPFFMVWFSLHSDKVLSALVLVGAFLTTWLGLIAIHRCEHRFKLSADTALALGSSLFLGLGILMASRLQFVDPLAYQQLQTFLYGQTATMIDTHLYLYGLLACLCLVFTGVAFRQIELTLFDPQFAASLPLKQRATHRFFTFLLLFVVIAGIRSAGVVLLSGMLIAPAIAARQLTDRFGQLLVISACFGVLSAFGGNVLALYLPMWLGKGFALPTGPMIILVAVGLCLMALLFAPKRGALFRHARILRFRFSCLCENLLKTLWKQGVGVRPLGLTALAEKQHRSLLLLRLALLHLQRKKWIAKKEHGYWLTKEGAIRATQLVRLHRLWELYLTSELNIHHDRVHRNAEEMEHILTPALEKKLTELLDHPKTDPHDQPIPEWEDVKC